MKKFPILLMCLLLGIIAIQCTVKETQTDLSDLEKNFASPPDEARIWVFWFWLNGNITREGITADLEAMKRAGIGGALIMEVDQGAPVGPVAFMGDEWRKMFKHTLLEAKRLGLEISMNNDAGWNGSGGPWITLDKAMQVVVTSEIQVDAGKKFSGILPKPESKEGFYRDITVLAFPSPPDADNPNYRINDLATKNMSWVGNSYAKMRVNPGIQVPSEQIIKSSEIINLSGRMDSTGNLIWDVPKITNSSTGKWTVIRFGHTFTGSKNNPAPASGSGPECDKLSPEGIEAQYDGMIAKLVSDAGTMAGKSFAATHVDSWEVGSQNWTPRMREEFKRLRGYDMTSFLPVLTGRFVDSPEVSERFLRDVRQTGSDLLSVNYIGHLRTLANRDGLRLSMESYATPANDQDVGNYIDEPISEFWWPGGILSWTNKAMSSLAHVNGRPITGAESFTSRDNERWLAHPANMKSLGDKAFCNGINRFIIHRYAMQPWIEDRRPGMTMGPWGVHFERTQTWWEDSKAWNEYIARCQYMLRQGTFVADILSIQSEEPKTRFSPMILSGYDYDGISPQAFVKNAAVENGQIILPSGMKYRLLVLPGDKDMSIGMLEKIAGLVDAGATILGNPPEKSVGLSGYPDSDQQIKRLSEKLWGTGSETNRPVGKGRVITGLTPTDALALMDIGPDFTSNLPMNYIHRRVAATEVYFVANPESEITSAICSFRVTGMNPEAWDPETGERKPITVYDEIDGITRIPMNFKSSGSLFIVFTPKRGDNPDRIESITRDGVELVKLDIPAPVAVPGSVPEIKPVETRSNFTMAAWIKPEMQIMLPQETNSGMSFIEHNDVIFAAPGQEVWTDEDTGAGITAGTNGICVYEHGKWYIPALLVQPTPITGWTHIAVVYQDNTPSLWVNGKMTRTGMKSSRISHGSIGVEHMRSIMPFNGQIIGLIQYSKALTEEEIKKIGSSVPDTSAQNQDKPSPEIDFVARELVKDGHYVIETADGKTRRADIKNPEKMELTGPWDLSFTKGWGAPDQVKLDKLISWSNHPDDGIRYYSGSATYRKTFTYTPTKGNQSGLEPTVYLDLGKVAIMAEVQLNGKKLGLLWNPPFRINISDYIRKGENHLEIRVVNLIINRMIGDEQLPDDSDRNTNGTLKSWPQWLTEGKPSPAGRLTFTTWRLWNKNSPLQVSGLLGPVTIQSVTRY